MNNKLEAWLEKYWIDRKKPSEVSTGQVWTLFKSEDDPDPGLIVTVENMNDDRFLLRPLHSDYDYRRGIDPILNQDHMDFRGKLVCLIDLTFYASLNAFKHSRFLGNINSKGIDNILEQSMKLQQAEAARTNLQEISQLREPSEKEEEKAIREGILELIPLGVSPSLFLKFQEEIMNFGVSLGMQFKSVSSESSWNEIRLFPSTLFSAGESNLYKIDLSSILSHQLVKEIFVPLAA